MKKLEPSNLLYVLDAIKPLIDMGGSGMFASNSLWSIVLGVFPPKDGERETQIMELNKEDSTELKVEGIRRLTELAESFTKRHDYEDENLKDFSLAVRQLIRYSSGDAQASLSLDELEDMYITFMTNYYHRSTNFGRKEEAISNLKLFGDEILHEDSDLRKRIVDIPS